MSTLSFAAGVAGDLTIIDPPRSGQRVVLRLPPELPADAIRAAPLPSLISTASAAEPRRVQRLASRFEGVPTIPGEVIAVAEKPEPRLEVQLARVVPKAEQVAAVRTDERKAA
ncbi:MAG: hypothetical protein AB7H66_07655 [Hyphomonadaceae bacterium]